MTGAYAASYLPWILIPVNASRGYGFVIYLYRE